METSPDRGQVILETLWVIVLLLMLLTAVVQFSQKVEDQLNHHQFEGHKWRNR